MLHSPVFIISTLAQSMLCKLLELIFRLNITYSVHISHATDTGTENFILFLDKLSIIVLTRTCIFVNVEKTR